MTAGKTWCNNGGVVAIAAVFCLLGASLAQAQADRYTTAALAASPSEASIEPKPGATTETAKIEALPSRTAARRLVDKYGDRLRCSRYMEQGSGEAVAVPGWHGFPTRKYRYSVTDKASGVRKEAVVVLLDAPAERIAQWIVTACRETRNEPLVRSADADRLFERILEQAGGQFPVIGIVYEDILPADGLNEIYCFRDGVTVAVEGVPHRGTAALSDEQVSASLSGKVLKVYRYARVQGTSPGEYRAAGGTLDVGTDAERKPAWMDAIRGGYQAAWNGDRYDMLSAWAKANLPSQH